MESVRMAGKRRASVPYSCYYAIAMLDNGLMGIFAG